MLPRYHILYGCVFTFFFYLFFPNTSYVNLSLIFLASFLIDFDHYTNAVYRTKSLSLFKAFNYYKSIIKKQEQQQKKGLKKREDDFQFFHTLEFHAFVLIVGLFFTPFVYIFIGMFFHSILDIYSLSKDKKLYIREYFMFNWMRNKLFSK